MRWIEKDEPGQFRDANEYLSGSRLSHTTGYYVDDDCGETAVPAVYVVRTDCAACADPNRTTDCADCETCGGSGDVFEYWAAVKGPYDDGGGQVDFEESYTDASEAARAAHGLAERYAETEREYQEKESARLEAQDMLPEDIAYLRHAHTRAVRIDDATGARMRKELRDKASQAVERIRRLRDRFNDFKEAQS